MEYEEFQTDISNYLKNYPNDTTGLVLRSNYNLKFNKKIAEADLNSIFKIDTNSKNTILKLAILYNELKEKQKSIQFYSRYHNLIENNQKDTIEFIISKLYYEAKNSNISLNKFKEFEKKGKYLDSTYYFISEILISNKNFNEAIEYLDKKLVISPNDFSTNYKKASIYIKQYNENSAKIEVIKGLKTEWKIKGIFKKSLPIILILLVYITVIYLYFKYYLIEDYDRKSIKKSYLHSIIIPFGIHNIYLKNKLKFYIHCIATASIFIYFSFEINYIIPYLNEIKFEISNNNTSLIVIICYSIYISVDLLTLPIQTFISNLNERKIVDFKKLNSQEETLKIIGENLEKRNIYINILFQKL